MGAKSFAVIVAAATLMGACAKENILPKTELPKQPLSSSIPCVPLTEAEKSACMREAQEAKNVCAKVERNNVICSDQQDFVKRLYDARDGK